MTRRRLGVSLALAALLLGASGCYKATFYKDPAALKGEEHEEWTNFYVFGLVGTENIELKRFCPVDEVALVRTGGNVGTGLVGFVTIGIYTPRKVYVTCAAPGGANTARRLELELDVSGRPVRAHAFQGEARVPLVFEPAGDGAWRFHEGSES